MTLEQLAKTIDHSLLHPELTRKEVMDGCELAFRCGVASVCVKPCHVKLAAGILEGSSVAVGTVVGFPHGGSTVATKVAETREAVADGATEIDMVVNIGELRSGKNGFIEREIRSVVAAAGAGVTVKVILENAYLSDEQKIAVCRAAERAGAGFIKTSTGFAPVEAKTEDIRLMGRIAGPALKVEVADGMHTLDSVLEAIDAGAERVGVTATASILNEHKRRAEVAV